VHPLPEDRPRPGRPGEAASRRRPVREGRRRSVAQRQIGIGGLGDAHVLLLQERVQGRLVHGGQRGPPQKGGCQRRGRRHVLVLQSVQHPMTGREGVRAKGEWATSIFVVNLTLVHMTVSNLTRKPTLSVTIKSSIPN
jgi:hypothetical protein